MSDTLKPLEEFADDKRQAVHEENMAIARDNRALRQSLRDRNEELAEVRRRLQVYEAINATRLSPPKWLAPKKTKGTHKAIPSLLLTDIHWGEKVEPEEIAGVNAYDTQIAEQRIERAAKGAIKICRDYRAGVEYEGLSLMLGGDLVSGEIHDELRETNVEATTESVVGVLEAMTSCVRLLADYFGRVHVACVVGNHGRLTRKRRSKRRARDSYDGLCYQLLAREFEKDDGVIVEVAPGSDAHVPVYSTRYCFTHGDQFRGGSGISGALAPLLLGVHRKRRRDAQAGFGWDVLVMGHFHQSYFLRDLIVGGSVIGYNEYAAQQNLPIEQAQAAMWFNTPERGIVGYEPVHLVDREAEGW